MTDLVTSADNQKLTVPTGIVTADHILGSVFWINEETLGAIWLNRRQDRGVFVSYDATTLVMTEVSCLIQGLFMS